MCFPVRSDCGTFCRARRRPRRGERGLRRPRHGEQCPATCKLAVTVAQLRTLGLWRHALRKVPEQNKVRLPSFPALTLLPPFNVQFRRCIASVHDQRARSRCLRPQNVRHLGTVLVAMNSIICHTPKRRFLGYSGQNRAVFYLACVQRAVHGGFEPTDDMRCP